MMIWLNDLDVNVPIFAIRRTLIGKRYQSCQRSLRVIHQRVDLGIQGREFPHYGIQGELCVALKREIYRPPPYLLTHVLCHFVP